MRGKLRHVTLCPAERVDVLQILLASDLYSACTLSSLTWVLAFPRSGTACGQQSASQTNHRQISSRLAQPGSTSRFFQNSIMVWEMTGSAGTLSYLDHYGATVIEFQGCREQRWNRIHRAIVVAARAPRGWREDRVMESLTATACTHTRTRRTNTLILPTETTVNTILCPLWLYQGIEWRIFSSVQ